MAQIAQQDNLVIKVSNVATPTSEEKTRLRKSYIRGTIHDVIVVEDTSTTEKNFKVVSTEYTKATKVVKVVAGSTTIDCGAIVDTDYKDEELADVD